MPRHHRPPRRQLVVTRASKGTAGNASPLPLPLFAPPPLPLPSALPPPCLPSWPQPRGTPPAAPPGAKPRGRQPGQPHPITRWKLNMYGTAEAAKSAPPPPLPPQYSLNACTIVTVATGGSIEWSARSRKADTIIILTRSRRNCSVVHAVCWKRRAAE